MPSSPDSPFDIPDDLKRSGDTRWVTRVEWTQNVQARRTAAQSINDITETVVAWDAEDYDTSTLHDNAVNNTRLTAIINGRYWVYAFARWADGIGTKRTTKIRLNGATILTLSIIPPVVGDRTAWEVGVGVYLAVGDYVEALVYQDSGGNLNLEGGATESYFGMFRTG